MPKPPPEEEIPEATAELIGEADAEGKAPELEETAIDDQGGEPPGRAPRSGLLKLAAVLVAVLLVGVALLAYRAHHRRKVLSEGLARADALLRLDTAAGYREAASLLEPLAAMDPVDAASVRAFALAMLFADYRASEVEADVEGLLVAPGRAQVVPSHAYLAMAAIALGHREAGSAATSAARAGESAWARVLQARVALLAGNPAAALDPAASAASEGAFPPGLALHGDVLRRLRKDLRGARAAYEAALAASPLEPRAAYGLAKLALAGHAPAEGAAAALQRVLSDAATPAQERSRAALHLAALSLRKGDRGAAGAALDAAALDGPARAWALRAATVESENHGPYRAVTGAPAGLQSASDDDPADLSPEPPPPPPKKVVKAPAKKKAAAKHVAKKTATKKTVEKKKAKVKKKTTSSSATTR